jgi:hypothetical protein
VGIIFQQANGGIFVVVGILPFDPSALEFLNAAGENVIRGEAWSISFV